jgi:hypothetical protein
MDNQVRAWLRSYPGNAMTWGFRVVEPPVMALWNASADSRSAVRASCRGVRSFGVPSAGCDRGQSAVRRELAPDTADVVDRMVARLESNGIGLSAPSPGEPMPDQDGRLVSLCAW